MKGSEKWLLVLALAIVSFVGGRILGSEMKRANPRAPETLQTNRPAATAVDDQSERNLPTPTNEAIPPAEEPGLAENFAFLPTGLDWESAHLDLAAVSDHFLAAARKNPARFARLLTAEARDMPVSLIEAGCWALARSDPGRAARFASGLRDPAMQRRLAPTIAMSLPPGDLDQLKESCQTLGISATSGRALEAQVYGHWAQNDSNWASEWLAGETEVHPNLRRAVVSGLAATDLAGALDLGRSLELSRRDLAHLFGAAGRENLGATIESLQHLPDDATRAEALSRMAVSWGKDAGHLSESEFAALRQAGETHYVAQAGPMQATQFSRVLLNAALESFPDEALQLFDEMPVHVTGADAFTRVALHENDGDWEASLRWIAEHPKNAQSSTRQRFGQFTHNWVRSDPAGAEAWAARNPDSPAAEFIQQNLDGR